MVLRRPSEPAALTVQVRFLAKAHVRLFDLLEGENLAVRQSVSVMKPHEEPADSSGRNGEGEKPPGFGQSYEPHEKQTNDNDQSNRMSSQKSASVVAEWNDFRGMRQVVRILLNGTVTNTHNG